MAPTVTFDLVHKPDRLVRGQNGISRLNPIQRPFDQVARRRAKQQSAILAENHLLIGEVQQDDLGVIGGRRTIDPPDTVKNARPDKRERVII
jgi:hypothetical protein